jgi:hypothetical protein
MPMPDDQLPPRGQPLAYPEAVHGWVSFDPPIVFWQITPEWWVPDRQTPEAEFDIPCQPHYASGKFKHYNIQSTTTKTEHFWLFSYIWL